MRCPETDNAPQTIEGACALAVLARWGVWQRAGMDGELRGLSLPEALASMPESCERDFARELLIRLEAGFMAGYIERRTLEKAK